MVAKFPFDSMSKSTAKLKHTPIELVWNLREGSPLAQSPEKRATSDLVKQRMVGETTLQVGLDCRSHWFRPSPKMRIIPGILGSCSNGETRGANPLQNPGSERKEDGDLESRHPSSWGKSIPSTVDSHPNPNHSCSPIFANLWGTCGQTLPPSHLRLP